jgi:hypothetical protein
MTRFFVLLLLLFSALFFGLEPAAQTALRYKDIKVLGVSLLTSDFRAFLGVCIAFCELVLIFSSVRILSTLGNIVKVLKDFIRLLPLAAFCLAAYKTFWPIINNEVIPASIAKRLGITQNPAYIAQTVDSRSFSQGVLVTLITLLFFALTDRIFNPKKGPPAVEWGSVEGKIKKPSDKKGWSIFGKK